MRDLTSLPAPSCAESASTVRVDAARLDRLVRLCVARSSTVAVSDALENTGPPVPRDAATDGLVREVLGRLKVKDPEPPLDPCAAALHLAAVLSDRSWVHGVRWDETASRLVIGATPPVPHDALKEFAGFRIVYDCGVLATDAVTADHVPDPPEGARLAEECLLAFRRQTLDAGVVATRWDDWANVIVARLDDRFTPAGIAKFKNQRVVFVDAQVDEKGTIAALEYITAQEEKAWFLGARWDVERLSLEAFRRTAFPIVVSNWRKTPRTFTTVDSRTEAVRVFAARYKGRAWCRDVTEGADGDIRVTTDGGPLSVYSPRCFLGRAVTYVRPTSEVVV